MEPLKEIHIAYDELDDDDELVHTYIHTYIVIEIITEYQ
jgi:hypothetical protein